MSDVNVVLEAVMMTVLKSWLMLHKSAVSLHQSHICLLWSYDLANCGLNPGLIALFLVLIMSFGLVLVLIVNFCLDSNTSVNAYNGAHSRTVW